MSWELHRWDSPDAVAASTLVWLWPNFNLVFALIALAGGVPGLFGLRLAIVHLGRLIYAQQYGFPLRPRLDTTDMI